MPKRRGYGMKKRLADAGLLHGTERAYRPMPRPLEPDVVMTDESLRVHANVFWVGAAVMYATAASVPLLARLIHELAPNVSLPSDVVSTTTTAISLTAIAFAGFWLYMAHRGAPALPWMNVIVGAGTALIGLAAITSSEYGPDMLAYLLIPAMAAAFFMPFKHAAAHLAAVSAIMLFVAFTSGETQHGQTIALNIMFFTLLSAGMLAIARTRIQDGILHNVALAGRDPLTGVANLRKFNERLQTEIDRAGRAGEPLTLLMIDFDDFKLVNDNYSYTLGDAVLVAGARAMSRVVRADELLARRGGDEFAVIAMGADAQNADALAERIKNAIRRERLKLCPDVSPEASVGLAEWRAGEMPTELLRRADASLHVSKMMVHAQEPFAET